jgi:hypothetical protein
VSQSFANFRRKPLAARENVGFFVGLWRNLSFVKQAISMACSVFVFPSSAPFPPLNALRTCFKTPVAQPAALDDAKTDPSAVAQAVDPSTLDLARMHIELLRQLGQSLVALHQRQCHFHLEGWRAVPPRSFCDDLSCSRPA